MTRKRRRLYAVLAGMAALGGAAFLVLSAFNDNLVFFYSPTDLKTKSVPVERPLRIGGLVEEHSLTRGADGKTIAFRVTDGANTVAVNYAGSLPDLFREGQGVVAEGALQRDGSFRAVTVLAKHDENYMPPEVAAALKKSGHWQETAGKAPGQAPGKVGATQ
jgi:cytochrome c-type biogenesis protein CcmE